MTYSPSPSPQLAAAISKFKVARSPILYGDKLQEVRCFERAIERFGLLTPLIVIPSGRKFIVIDGKKRFAALRRMQAKGTLPRDLHRIPYIILDSKTDTAHAHAATSNLMGNREQYNHVKKLYTSGHSLMDIATQLYMSKSCVQEILSVARLSPRLKLSYFSGQLSRPQAKALATLTRHDMQEALLVQLGPFAQEADILLAISKRQTVIALDPENVIILPSQNTKPAFKTAA